MFPSSRPFSIVYSVTFADTLAISIFSLVSAFLNKMLNPVSLLLLSFQRSNTLVFPILSMVMSEGACTLADCSSPSLSLEQAPKAHVNNIAINTDKTELIKLPLLKLYIERDTIKVPETNVFLPNSKLSAKAEITNYNTKDLTFNVGLNGSVNSRDIKAVKTNYAVYPIKLSVYGNSSIQNIIAQVVICLLYTSPSPRD